LRSGTDHEYRTGSKTVGSRPARSRETLFPYPAQVSDDDGMSTALTSGEDGRAGGEAGGTQTASADLHALIGQKGDRHVSVCIPARNEAATIGPIVHSIASTLAGESGGWPLVDELMVIDDNSDDRTGELALRAGARVIASEAGRGGKGQAMRTALKAAQGDLIVFVDADVTNFGPHFVTGLLGPLLSDESVTLVKGYYQRPLHGAPDGGGRVTELVARPVIDLLFPHLASIRQPLAGETAAHRWVLEKCGLAEGYAVELALLIDVAARFGVETIAQVDLGVRVHRNRPLAELRPQATDILRASLARATPLTPD
jgi:glucosyl-3-phosphoglycerate synthase